VQIWTVHHRDGTYSASTLPAEWALVDEEGTEYRYGEDEWAIALADFVVERMRWEINLGQFAEMVGGTAPDFEWVSEIEDLLSSARLHTTQRIGISTEHGGTLLRLMAVELDGSLCHRTADDDSDVPIQTAVTFETDTAQVYLHGEPYPK
jgi:hypothetical protein